MAEIANKDYLEWKMYIENELKVLNNTQLDYDLRGNFLELLKAIINEMIIAIYSLSFIKKFFRSLKWFCEINTEKQIPVKQKKVEKKNFFTSSGGEIMMPG